MGFKKTVIKAGNGVLPRRGQKVTVHCTGYGKNGDCSFIFFFKITLKIVGPLD